MFSMDLQRDIRDTGVNVSVFILGSVPDTNIYNEGIKKRDYAERRARYQEHLKLDLPGTFRGQPVQVVV